MRLAGGIGVLFLRSIHAPQTAQTRAAYPPFQPTETNRMNTRTLLIPVLSAALAVAGCVSLGSGPNDSDSDSGSSATRSSGGSRVSDSEITASIKEAFKQDPQLAAASISVNAENGVVTLSGNVPTALVYNRAISVARSAPGVRPPVNAANLKF